MKGGFYMYVNVAYSVNENPNLENLSVPLQINNCGYYRVHTGPIIATEHPEGRNDYQLLYIAAGKGHFFGVHVHAAWFNLKWEDTRYQSEQYPLLGAGISYGYKLPFSEHWGAEFTLGAGYANMKYNTYYNIENGAKLDTRKRNYWGITRAGASLVYRF